MEQSTSEHEPAPTPWGARSWRLIPLALWFSPLSAAAFVVGAVERPHRRRVAARLAIISLAWIALDVVLVTRGLRWELLALAHGVWSCVGGLACAMTAEVARRRRWTLRRGPRLRALLPPWSAVPSVLACGVVIYVVVVTYTALGALTVRALDPASRTVLPVEALFWSLPAAALGIGLGLLWRRWLGSVRIDTVARFLLAGHVLGFALVLVIGGMALGWHALDAGESAQMGKSPYDLSAGIAGFAFLVTPLLGYAFYVSVAPTGGRVPARMALCIALMIASYLQLDVATGTVAEVRRALARRGLGEQGSASATHWRHYVATYPDAADHAESLWLLAEEQVRAGHTADARTTYRALAALPEDVPGQRYVRWSAALSTTTVRATDEPRTFVAQVQSFPDAPYLDGAWRSALSLLSASPATTQEDLLARLRDVSLSDEKLDLPALGNLFAAAAYARALGVDVAVAPMSLAEIRTQLRADRPVLLHRPDGWYCLVGLDPTWDTFLYFDYGGETGPIRERQRAGAAKSLFADGDAPDGFMLDQALLRALPASEVALALSDGLGLVATLPPVPQPAAPGWNAFLLGELALAAGDPQRALDHYADASALLADPDRLLPYIHVAELLATAPETHIVTRGFPPIAPADARPTRHADLRERAGASFTHVDHATLPTPLLQRIAELRSLHDADERDERITIYETMVARYPDHEPFLGALAEAYRVAARHAERARIHRHLTTLEQSEPNHWYRWVDALLEAGRADDAHAALGLAFERGHFWDPRYDALAGRTALARGDYARAERKLEEALAADLANPELRAALALALEGLGRTSEADAQWRWVELVAVDDVHTRLAGRRLARAGAAQE